MQSDYAQQYRALWNQHWWWRSRRLFVLHQIQRILRQARIDSILDIGCGDALFFDDLAGFAPTWGLEPDPTLLSDQNPHRERISVCPFDRNFQPGQTYDLVVMLDVLEHIEDDQTALEHLYSLINPGGHVVLTVPALMLLWSRHDDANHHFRRYTRRNLRAVIRQSGFLIQRSGYYFCWAVAPLLLRRMLHPAEPHGENEKPTLDYQVPIPSAAINTAFYSLSRADHFLARYLPLPIGSSLFAVLRKPI